MDDVAKKYILECGKETPMNIATLRRIFEIKHPEQMVAITKEVEEVSERLRTLFGVSCEVNCPVKYTDGKTILYCGIDIFR